MMNAVRTPTQTSIMGFFFFASHMARKMPDINMAHGSAAGGR
jgi:hypothetical protein